MTRGQTYSFVETVRDHLTGDTVDLTDYDVHFAMRADVKVPASVQLTTRDPLPSGWRAGVTKLAQIGDTLGKYQVTIIPADTQDLVALGHSDPWFYETWIDSVSDTRPDISHSTLDLYPQIVDVP